MSTHAHMTEHDETTGGATPGTGANAEPREPRAGTVEGGASLLKVLKDQRKIELIALGMAVAGFWIIGQLGEWRLATCLAIGVGLGLVNHLATEFWLLRIIANGDEPSRGQMVRATMFRLIALTLVAVALAVWLWPDGIGLLLGLAIFRLLALMMTSITLLKELKSE
jgi:hypothetical protein